MTRQLKPSSESRNAARLTIGLPVFNGEQYLVETIQNILDQTFDNFKLIICDNASDDKTPKICLNYTQSDHRVQYFRASVNIGAIANFNRTFALARTPLFKWAAHDDLYRPEYLATCVQLLDENPDAVLAHSGTAFIDEGGEFFPFDPIEQTYLDPKTGIRQMPDSPDIGKSQNAVVRFKDVLTRARWGSHMFGVIRRDALLRTKPLPNFAGSDRAMLAELALLGRFVARGERLFFKRFHGGSSWALNQAQLKSFLGDNNENYSRRSELKEVATRAALTFSESCLCGQANFKFQNASLPHILST